MKIKKGSERKVSDFNRTLPDYRLGGWNGHKSMTQKGKDKGWMDHMDEWVDVCMYALVVDERGGCMEASTNGYRDDRWVYR